MDLHQSAKRLLSYPNDNLRVPANLRRIISKGRPNILYLILLAFTCLLSTQYPQSPDPVVCEAG